MPAKGFTENVRGPVVLGVSLLYAGTSLSVIQGAKAPTGPVQKCRASNPELCDKEEEALLNAYLEMTEPELDMEMQKGSKAIEQANQDFETKLSEFQAAELALKAQKQAAKAPWLRTTGLARAIAVLRQRREAAKDTAGAATCSSPSQMSSRPVHINPVSVKETGLGTARIMDAAGTQFDFSIDNERAAKQLIGVLSKFLLEGTGD